MILNVVKSLVETRTKEEIDQAIVAFETKLENTLGVEGKDDGEKLSNLLAASEIKTAVLAGTPINEAIRDFSRRVRAVLKPAGGGFGR